MSWHPVLPLLPWLGFRGVLVVLKAPAARRATAASGCRHRITRTWKFLDAAFDLLLADQPCLYSSFPSTDFVLSENVVLKLLSEISHRCKNNVLACERSQTVVHAASGFSWHHRRTGCSAMPCFSDVFTVWTRTGWVFRLAHVAGQEFTLASWCAFVVSRV